MPRHPILTAPKLKALRAALPDHPHRNRQTPLTVAAWEQLGRPYVWEFVGVLKSYTAFKDNGYGVMALFGKDELLGTTRGVILTTPKVVLLDKEYYNLPKYLWR